MLDFRLWAVCLSAVVDVVTAGVVGVAAVVAFVPANIGLRTNSLFLSASIKQIQPGRLAISWMLARKVCALDFAALVVQGA